MVGGNGRRVTWRLAARYADELNLDGLTPDEVEEALPVIAARCLEEGRDPASLRVSVYAGPHLLTHGAARVAALRRFGELGLARVIVDVDAQALYSPGPLDSLARDVEAAGFALQPA